MLKNTLLSVDDFAQRRAALLASMPEQSITIIQSAKEITRSNDTEYSFCQDKNFYYLTGFNEPDALLVLTKGKDASCQSVLFCRAKDPHMEIWHGRRVGPDAAQAEFGIDVAHANDQIDEQILSYLETHQFVYCLFSDAQLMTKISDWIGRVAAQSRVGKKAPKSIHDCADAINELRLHKSENEIEIMRLVNRISGDAHQRAMKATAENKFEYQIEAELLHEFALGGARQPAYGSIVAGGDNANILHYTDNDAALRKGDLLLIDAGGELAGYAADITRTFPVSGKFTAPQKLIYQLVLDAQIAAINAIKPGANFSQLNDLVCDILTEGLYKLGILTGELTQLLNDKACKKYFIHGLGHWLGLDVHDVGDYHANEQRQQLRPFSPGMVMTIEPGLYFPVGCEVDKKWQGIGVRIEDNILVTDDGFENLTVNAPKTVDAIEALMQKD